MPAQQKYLDELRERPVKMILEILRQAGNGNSRGQHACLRSEESARDLWTHPLLYLYSAGTVANIVWAAAGISGGMDEAALP